MSEVRAAGPSRPEGRGRGVLRALARHRLLLVVLFLFAVLSSLYNALTPIWEASDEQDHFQYAKYVADHWRLPPHDLPGLHASEAHQPPLYYLVAALPISTVQADLQREWRKNPYVTWQGHPLRHAIAVHTEAEAFPYYGLTLAVHVGRAASTGFGLVTVACAYGLAYVLTRRRLLAAVAAAALAFTPGFIFTASTINNDNAAIATGSAGMLLAVVIARADPPRAWHFLALGAVVALGTLSKLNGLFLLSLPFVLTPLVWRKTRDLRRTAGYTALSLGVWLALGFWWLVRSHFAGESPTLTPAGTAEPHFTMDAKGVFNFAEGMFTTYWGRFGWQNVPLPTWLYVVLGLLVTAMFLLTVRALWTLWRNGRLRALVPLLPAAGAFLVLVAIIAGRYFGDPGPGQDHARFLFPGAALLVFPLAVGLLGWPLERWRVYPAAAVLLGLFTLAVASPFVYIRPAFTQHVPLATRLPSGQPHTTFPIDYESVRLVGFSLADTEVRPGEAVKVTLWWQALGESRPDFVGFVHLVGAGGESYVSDAVPLEKELPPSAWRAGEYARDERTIVLPPDAPAGSYVVEVGAYLWPETVPLAGWHEGAEATRFQVARVKVPQPPVEPPAALAGRLGDFEVALLSAAGDGPGTPLRVTLCWRALKPTTADYKVSVQVIGPDGRLAAQNDSEPAAGRYPTSIWSKGEWVRDEHVVRLPEHLTGEFRLAVSMYLDGAPALPVTAGESKSPGLLELGGVVVEPAEP